MAETISDKILKLGFDLDKPSANAVVKQIDQMDKSLDTLQKREKSLAATTAQAGQNFTKFAQDVMRGRDAILKGTAALKEQESVLDRYKRKVEETNRLQPVGGGGGGGGGGKFASISSGIGTALGSAGFGELGGVAQQIGNIAQVAQQAGPALSGVEGGLAGLGVAGPIAIAAIIAMQIAIKDFVKLLDAAKATVDNAFTAQDSYYEAIKTGTKETIQAEIDQRKARAEILRAEIAETKKVLDSMDLITKAIAGGQFEDRLAELQKQLNESEQVTGRLTVALNDEAVAARTAAQQTEKVTDAIEERIKSSQTTQLKLSDEIEKIRSDSAQKEADILANASRRWVEIALQAARAETDAATKLKTDLAEGSIKATQQQQDILRSYQDGEKKAARDHFRAMNKIRKDAENQEFELILTRDFAGLAKLRRQTDQQLQAEEERNQEERAQRLVDLRIKLRDNQIGYIREREARNRAYIQQIADLRTNLTRQLQDNRSAAQNELNLLHSQLTTSLKMKQDAYAAELRLEAFYLQERNRLMAEAAGAMLPRTNTTHGGPTSIPQTSTRPQLSTQVHAMAKGGYLRPGQTALVNEGYPGQRERFGGSWLPAGKGLFMPMESGRVDPSGGGGPSIVMHNVINESKDPRATRRMMEDVVAKAFDRIAS